MGGRGETFVLETGGGLGKWYLFRKLAVGLGKWYLFRKLTAVLGLTLVS